MNGHIAELGGNGVEKRSVHPDRSRPTSRDNATIAAAATNAVAGVTSASASNPSLSASRDALPSLKGLPRGSGNAPTGSRLMSIGKRKERTLAKTNGHMKASHLRMFATTVYRQKLRRHTGAVWTIEFSKDGRYLASGGEDCVVRVWITSDGSMASSSGVLEGSSADLSFRGYFEQIPLREYRGHDKDIVDLDWSNENFLVSASMDTTVRLWHPSQPQALRTFAHRDIVSTVNFHSIDNTVFVSATFNGMLSLWSLLRDEAPLSQMTMEDCVTCSAISSDGRLAMIGTAAGHVRFCSVRNDVTGSWMLQDFTQLDVYPEADSTDTWTGSTADKSTRKACKLSGICLSPSGRECFITTSDSRVRLHRMNDKSLHTIFRGHSNEQRLVKTRISDDGRLILCPSEPSSLGIWETSATPTHSTSRAKRRINIVNSMESIVVEDERFSGKVHVSAAVFAPTSSAAAAVKRGSVAEAGDDGESVRGQMRRWATAHIGSSAAAAADDNSAHGRPLSSSAGAILSTADVEYTIVTATLHGTIIVLQSDQSKR